MNFTAYGFVDHLFTKIENENAKRDDPFLVSLLNDIKAWRTEQSKTPLFMLPKDVLILLIESLPMRDIGVVSQLCRYTYMLVDADVIWQKKASELYGITTKNTLLTWRLYFKANYATWNTFPGRLAYYAMELEKGIKWSGVFDSWRQRRAPWIDECRKITTVREAIALLIELETIVVEGALKDEWLPFRLTWRESLKKLSHYNQIKPYLIEIRNNLKQETFTGIWLTNGDEWYNDIYAEQSTRFLRYTLLHRTTETFQQTFTPPPQTPKRSCIVQ